MINEMKQVTMSVQNKEESVIGTQQFDQISKQISWDDEGDHGVS